MSCIFCKIVKGEIPSKKVLETDALVAFEDVHPQAPKHLLVVPKRHVESVGGLADADAALAGQLLLGCRDAAKKAGLADFRVVANTGAGAGQSVFHLHLHVLGGRPLGWPPG